MSEAELQRDVIGLADSLGLLWHHCPFARRCNGNPGFPDLILAGRRGLLLAELKGADGETSPDQDQWLWTLDKGGAETALWYPRSWDTGIIRRRLEQLAGPARF